MTQEEYVIPPSTMSKILEEMKKLNVNLEIISDTIDHIPQYGAHLESIAESLTKPSQDNECCKDEPEETKERKVESYSILFNVSAKTDNPLKVVGEIIDHLTETYGEDTKVKDLSIYST